MNKNKLLNILCSMLMGVIFTVALLMVFFLSGMVSVEKKDIVFSTSSASAVYDGKPLTNHTWRISSGKLRDGHRAVVTFTGTQTSAGESPNTVEIKILDAAGADVTSDYNIRYDLGTLEVTPRMLEIRSSDASKIYNGTPLRSPDYTVEGKLVNGHKAIAIVTGSRTDIGISPNTIASAVILDRYGKDVTKNYALVMTSGILTVTDANGNAGAGIPADPDHVLYTVYSDYTGVLYLKTESFGNYRGNAWDDAPDYAQYINGKFSASYLTSYALMNSGAEKAHLVIKPNYPAYALPYYMDMQDLSGYTYQTSDVEYKGTEKQYELDYYFYEGAPELPASLEIYERYYRSFVRSNYLSIDSETLEFMQGIIKEQGFSANDADVVNKIAAYIQNSAVYNMGFDQALENEANVAIAFLRDYKEGVCRHYAAAATMLYRALGIPARYTVGVLAAVEAGEWTSVAAKSSHAWVEVYLDGIGWIQVEVTGSVDGGVAGQGGGGNGGSGSGEGEEGDGDGEGGGEGGGSGSGSGGNGGSGEGIPLEVYPSPTDKKYDGTPLSAPQTVRGLEEYLKKGYTYSAAISGTRTEIGISESTIESLLVFDPDGNDVTDKLNLVLKTGKIHVYEKELFFSSNSLNIVYGEAYELTAAMNAASLLPDGYTYKTASTLAIAPGMHSNIFDVTVFDADGNDVTERYKITRTYGLVTVSQAHITVKAGDASKPYDGTPLTCDEIEIIGGSLAYEDTVYVYRTEGSQTAVGKAENIVTSIIILNAESKDVTKNYIIELESGTLRVTLPK